MAKPARFTEASGPTVEYLAEVIRDLASQASHYGPSPEIGKPCTRGFDCLLWLARDYLVPEDLRRD